MEETVDVHPDVIILDLGLPDIDGREVIARIRKRTKTPIVILSVRDDPAEKIAALDAGADDYLTKPFSTEELLARLRAVMRRLLPLDKEEVLKVGKLCMDITKRRVSIGNNEVELSPIEYELLKLFLLNAGKVLYSPASNFGKYGIRPNILKVFCIYYESRSAICEARSSLIRIGLPIS